jgi:hypothetical protein
MTYETWTNEVNKRLASKILITLEATDFGMDIWGLWDAGVSPSEAVDAILEEIKFNSF